MSVFVTAKTVVTHEIDVVSNDGLRAHSRPDWVHTFRQNHYSGDWRRSVSCVAIPWGLELSEENLTWRRCLNDVLMMLCDKLLAIENHPSFVIPSTDAHATV